MWYISTNYNKILGHLSNQNIFVLTRDMNSLNSCFADKILFDNSGLQYAIPVDIEYKLQITDDDTAIFQEALSENWHFDTLNSINNTSKQEVFNKPIIVIVPVELAFGDLWLLTKKLKEPADGIVPPYFSENNKIFVGLIRIDEEDRPTLNYLKNLGMIEIKE